jgi:hypothetical protein
MIALPATIKLVGAAGGGISNAAVSIIKAASGWPGGDIIGIQGGTATSVYALQIQDLLIHGNSQTSTGYGINLTQAETSRYFLVKNVTFTALTAFKGEICADGCEDGAIENCFSNTNEGGVYWHTNGGTWRMSNSKFASAHIWGQSMYISGTTFGFGGVTIEPSSASGSYSATTSGRAVFSGCYQNGVTAGTLNIFMYSDPQSTGKACTIVDVGGWWNYQAGENTPGYVAGTALSVISIGTRFSLPGAYGTLLPIPLHTAAGGAAYVVGADFSGSGTSQTLAQLLTNSTANIPNVSNGPSNQLGVMPSISSIPSPTPAGITSTSAFVMLGLGQLATIAVPEFTPKLTGKVKVIVTGKAGNNAASDGYALKGMYGTVAGSPSGLTPPANGDAVVGTSFTNQIGYTTGNALPPFSCCGVATLTVGTTYWFDLAVEATTGGTVTVSNTCVIIEELAA